MPAWTGQTFWQPGTYGGTNPETGDPQSWWDTPFVRDFGISENSPYGEFERYLTDNGFAGFDRRGEWGRQNYNRTRSAWEAAHMDNPTLSYRDFLNTLPDFNNLYNSLSGAARGDNTPGQTRRILWG